MLSRVGRMLYSKDTSMKMKSSIFSVFSLLALTLPVLPVNAGECFVGNVQQLSGTVTTGSSGVRMRDTACMDQSSVLSTVPANTKVTVLGAWDGWYKVEYGGQRGWLYGTYVGNVSTTNGSEKEYAAFEAAYPSGGTGSSAAPTTAPAPSDGSLLDRMKGYILLQVQSHGEAWYVDPITAKRYYMKDGPTAYEMMRSFGLGVSEADYAKIAAGNTTLKTRLRGRIILRAQAHGEAYYIHPKHLAVYYLQNGDEAYRVMRLYSLGITNTDLNSISSSEIPLKISQSPTTATAITVTAPAVSGSIAVSAYQEGWKPSKISLVTLNEYWLKKVNALRVAKGLRQLSLDQRFVDTATMWSAAMLSKGELTHDRPDGKSMHDWMDAQNLSFMERNSVGGWEENYFSENIAYDYIANSQEDAEHALDRVMEMFLKEAADNGPHYRTQVHPDWNSVGVGFAFEKLTYENAKVYMTFHYGSLVK